MNRRLAISAPLARARHPSGAGLNIIDPAALVLQVSNQNRHPHVFTFAATQDVKNVRMAVLNRDWGTNARDLVARFQGSAYFSEVLHLKSEAEVARAIDSRSVLLVVATFAGKSFLPAKWPPAKRRPCS